MLNVLRLPDLELTRTQPRSTVTRDLPKRAFDLVVGALALLVVAPLLQLLLAAIMLESPGNPIFVQERLGLNGKRFRLLKLRTMVPDAERRRAEIEHLNEALPPLFK